MLNWDYLMLARFIGYSFFASSGLRQRGAAIILAMLTLMLVAGISSFVIRNYGAAVASISGRHDQAQARLLARGAVDWARNVLSEDARTSTTDHYNEIWATRVPPTPVEEGEVGGELDELSGHFDLNGLVRAGVIDLGQVAVFGNLLTELGIPSNTAASMANSLAAWIKTDSVAATGADFGATGGIMPTAKATGSLLIDVDELKQVPGFSAELVNRLQPFVVALPTAAPLNVNTASAEVLVATIPGLGIDQARILVAQRQSAPFKDLTDFAARLPKGATMSGKVSLSVSGRYFLASVRARYGQATTRMQVLLDRQNKWSEIVWQKLL
jgi:general secretion pathway protein K